MIVDINHDKLRANVMYILKHHGTRTRGEDVRMEQVCDKLMELFDDVYNARHLISNMKDCGPTIIEISGL